DTDEDLRDFRERFALPDDWVLLRGADRAFLDSLGFRIRKLADGFDHPNATYVFSPSGKWAATLTGLSFDAAELRAARDRALHAGGIGAWLVRPEAWILFACGGLALSLAVVLSRRRAT